MSAREIQFSYRSEAAVSVRTRLRNIANIGYPGQWILHNETIYYPFVDTRPHTRDAKRDIHIHLHGPDGALKETGLMWPADVPAPNFDDCDFWLSTRRRLKKGMDQAREGLVQPRFSPQELQVLEALCRQEGTLYYEERQQVLRKTKAETRAALSSLASLGRQGQWVLHQEELYLPAIDTRPSTRKPPGEHVTIRCGISEKEDNMVLYWDGDGEQPDFEDPEYWRQKAADLQSKAALAKQSLLEPNFTPEELCALEEMEDDYGHVFALYRQAREEEKHAAPSPPLSPADHRMGDERRSVAHLLQQLAERGRAGMYVLLSEELYTKDTDIFRRDWHHGNVDSEDHVGSDDEYTASVPPIPGHRDLYTFGLRYKCTPPPPDFNDISYWERKRLQLAASLRDVREGRVHPEFTPTELRQIQWYEYYTESEEAFVDKQRDPLREWLDIHAVISPGSAEAPLPPPVKLYLDRDEYPSSVATTITDNDSEFIATRYEAEMRSKRKSPSDEEDGMEPAPSPHKRRTAVWPPSPSSTAPAASAQPPLSQKPMPAKRILRERKPAPAPQPREGPAKEKEATKATKTKAEAPKATDTNASGKNTGKGAPQRKPTEKKAKPAKQQLPKKTKREPRGKPVQQNKVAKNKARQQKPKAPATRPDGQPLRRSLRIAARAAKTV